MRISLVKTAYAAFLLIGLVYAFVTLRGPNGIAGMMDRQRQVREYEKGNQQLQREISLKKERIDRLATNPAEQEMEIRQRYKLARPGEKIFILNDAKPAK